MHDDDGHQLTRHIRQIMVREFGGEGQKRLMQSEVAIIGMGGIGAPVALYLAAAGIGRLILYDDDIVQISNLGRQVLYNHADEGKPKAYVAAQKLAAQNPDVTVDCLGRFDDRTQSTAHLWIDGTDSFETRAMINARATQLRKPVLAASLAQWEGQVAHYAPATHAGCYACLYPESTDMSAVPNCAEAGIISPVAGWVGTMAALEALKIIARIHPLPAGQMLIMDGLYREMRQIKIKRRADCPQCASAQK